MQKKRRASSVERQPRSTFVLALDGFALSLIRHMRTPVRAGTPAGGSTSTGAQHDRAPGVPGRPVTPSAVVHTGARDSLIQIEEIKSINVLF
jgi:hypothetical protein